jgi:fatty-acid desaturase
MSDQALSTRVASASGPAGSDPAVVPHYRIDWTNLLGLIGYHLLALLAFFPWFFSWTGVALCVFGVYVFGMLGVNLCFHRLLTHRSFECPRWLEYTLAILGVCSTQDSPVYWVAVHRRHHQFADDERDPHSPIASFFWAHVGWLILKSDDLERAAVTQRHAKDLLRDPFYRKLETYWVAAAPACWILFFSAGFGVARLTGSNTFDAIQFGTSLLLWGVVVRTVVVWHITNSVNSVTHLWGYRNYETRDGSRNNFVLGVLAHGEGWHNNHHADPNSAMHGHQWWEFDPVFLVIRLLAVVGLAKGVVLPATRRG